MAPAILNSRATDEDAAGMLFAYNRDVRFGSQIVDSQIESLICPNRFKYHSHTVKYFDS